MKYFIPLFLGILVFTGCKKDEPDKAIIGESLWPCYQATEFTCSGAQADVHFSGKLDGKEFCLNEGEKEYERQNGYVAVGNGVTQIASGFVLRLHRTNRSYSQPYVYLWYYTGSGAFSDRAVVDSAFQVGKQQQWIKDDNATSFTERGFKLDIEVICPDGDESNGSPIMVFDTNGPQKNAYIRCTRLEKTETAEGTLYKVTLQMGCDLYNGNQIWRTLTDGEYTQEFLIEK
jgi:hypothetical protein